MGRQKPIFFPSDCPLTTSSPAASSLDDTLTKPLSSSWPTPFANRVSFSLWCYGGDDRWELIAGERRWRASQKAGLTDVPVVIREASDEEVLERPWWRTCNETSTLLKRRRLPAAHHRAPQAGSRRIQGRKEPMAVANALRLLKLPDGARQMVKEGTLSVGHAKALGLGTLSSGRSARRSFRDN